MNKYNKTYDLERKELKISPLLILLLISITIIIVHIIVMFSGINNHLHTFKEVLLDSTGLILLLFPMLYYFVFRPLILEINKREKAQRELLLSELKFRNLVETMNEGIVIYDDNRTITFINQKFSEMICLPKEK